MRVRFFECSILFCLSVGKDEECTSGAASLLNISNFGAVHSQKEILMDKQNLRILFMGTPDFAVASLKALVEGGYCVVGVVTMPDKPMGRHGSVLQASPVKQYAAAHGLRVLQPERLSDPAFVDKLRKLRADLQIVVAFRMLPRVVWEMPRLGTFNLHASLLPQYRGAAPINWAVIHGDKETGVTTFFLRHEIDTGRIILQRRVPIAEIRQNDYNLNIPRYIDTYQEEAPIDLPTVMHRIHDLEARRADLDRQIAAYFAELGLTDIK